MSEELSNFLEGSILPLAKAPPPFVKQLLSPENLEIWNAAFTHESVNLNASQNYDQFEKLGDAVLKASFINYLLHKYPNMSSSGLSSLSSHYLSKKSLGKISFNLNLPVYLNTKISKDLSSAEDLFESLIGALFWIGNKIKYGSGFILADAFVFSVFSNVPIDMAITRGPPKTQLKEIFEAMHWGKPVEKWSQTNPSLPGKFTISYTPEALEFFKEQGARQNSILATAEGGSKTIASDRASVNALKRLEEIGITFQWAEQYKRSVEFSDPKLAPYIPKLEEKASSEGFSNVYFNPVRITNREKIIQLIGEYPGGETKEIGQVQGTPESSNSSLHLKLIKKYLA